MKNNSQYLSDLEQEKQQLIKDFSKQFIQRSDLYARQLDNGSYVCVREPFSDNLMYQHLRGKITLGTYLLSADNTARFTVLDADSEQEFDRLKAVAADLKKQNIPSYLEASRRGGHLWLFFGHPISGQKARGFGMGIAKTYRLGKMEVYPKQDTIGTGTGSLIRLPFGIHRKTGKRYYFITPDGGLLATPRKQLDILCHPETVSVEMIDRYKYVEHSQGHVANERRERLRRYPLMEFLAGYVDLKPSSSGAVGLCPFHNDQQSSFGVNVVGNYWNCFAGCGGGDIVSFWMKFRSCDYSTAVKELEEALYGSAAG